jgi:hypothetical protein
MDHERALLRSMRLEALPEIQDEKEALAEAYEIELSRLRCSPEVLAALEPGVRGQLHEAMRAFQETVTANLNALLAAQSVVEKLLRNIGDSLARSAAGFTYGARGQGAPAEARGRVIAVAFDRKL